jgi:prevent-host-death family protein
MAEAKAKLSEVVELAMHEGPQELTRNGKDAVVIVAKKEWQQAQAEPPNIFDVLQLAQVNDGELVTERTRDYPRSVIL